MYMTHYMALLADNQPWNLILFMAVPVILAETVAITELFILLGRAYDGALRRINRAASIAAGIYFTGVFIYLMLNAVVPLTQQGLWRGPADWIAVGFYLSGVIPLGGLALLDLNWICRRADVQRRMAIHASLVALFLVVAHVAMVFGMLDPSVLGAMPMAAAHAGH
ncbi:DUF6803 family protein [Chitiniphilus eburneus]|uniref:Permease n=1 Tax=Chitiniphilus eburneus TaxID=2571148 RepID=A0A4V5MS44_9NEIS|nr:DUF6803 family protein [Chitiniphilus eburneus]TJZ78828.1 permease [Chitiniphilus eburneus]